MYGGGGVSCVSWQKILIFPENVRKEIDKYCLLCSKSTFPKSSISHASSFHVWLADTAFPYEWFTPFQWFIFNKHQYVPWGNLFSRQYWNDIVMYIILIHYVQFWILSIYEQIFFKPFIEWNERDIKMDFGSPFTVW